ncbi:MAG: T-cell receptor beta chain V region [Verrucomicrobia bacterium]|nr:T-cell receptor beta chain V region [Verrucomicrobiota bacterium]
MLYAGFYQLGRPIDLEKWEAFFRSIPVEGRFVVTTFHHNPNEGIHDEYRRTEYFHRVRAPSLQDLLVHFDPDWASLDPQQQGQFIAYLVSINPALQIAGSDIERPSSTRFRIWVPSLEALQSAVNLSANP